MWLVNSIVSWLVGCLCDLLGYLVSLFVNMFGLSENGKTYDLFLDVFPVARDLGNALFMIGYALISVIAIYQLFKSFFGPLAESEHPTHIVGRFMIATALVSLSKPICIALTDMGAIVYQALDKIEIGEGKTAEEVVADMSEKIHAGDWISAIAATSIGGGVLYFIVALGMIFIIQEFFKLFVESIERYIILGILAIFAPLCLATSVSKNTSRVAFSWFQMMLSQVILMCLNVVFLKGCMSGLYNVFVVKDFSAQGAKGEILTLPLGFIMIAAWLRVGQHVDDYLNQLGLTAARSGGFGNELLGSLSRAERSANNLVNRTYGTQFGKNGEARNPLTSAIGGALTFGRDRKLDAMRTDGARSTVPNRLLDGFAKKMPAFNKDLSMAMKRGMTLGGSQVGDALANKFGIKGMNATEACTLSRDKNTGAYKAHLDFGNGNTADFTNDKAAGVDGAKAFEGMDGKSWYLTGASGDKAIDALAFGSGLDSATKGADKQLSPEKAFALSGQGFSGDGMERVMTDSNGKQYQQGLFNSNGQLVPESEASKSIIDNNGNAIADAVGINSSGFAIDSNGNVIKDANNMDMQAKEQYISAAGEELHKGYSDISADGVVSNKENRGVNTSDLRDTYYDRAHDTTYREADPGSGVYYKNNDTSTAYTNVSSDYTAFKGKDGEMYNLAEGNLQRYSYDTAKGQYYEDANGNYMMERGGNYREAELTKDGNGNSHISLYDTSMASVNPARFGEMTFSDSSRGHDYKLNSSGNYIMTDNGEMRRVFDTSASYHKGDRVQVEDPNHPGSAIYATAASSSRFSRVDTIGGFELDSAGRPAMTRGQLPAADSFRNGQSIIRDSTGSTHWIASGALTPEGRQEYLSEGYFRAGEYLVKHSNDYTESFGYHGRSVYRNVNQQKEFARYYGLDESRFSNSTQIGLYEDHAVVLPNVSNRRVLNLAKSEKTDSGTIYTFKNVSHIYDHPVANSTPIEGANGRTRFVVEASAMYNATTKKWDFTDANMGSSPKDNSTYMKRTIFGKKNGPAGRGR